MNKDMEEIILTSVGMVAGGAMGAAVFALGGWGAVAASILGLLVWMGVRLWWATTP